MLEIGENVKAGMVREHQGQTGIENWKRMTRTRGGNARGGKKSGVRLMSRLVESFIFVKAEFIRALFYIFNTRSVFIFIWSSAFEGVGNTRKEETARIRS